jgi:NitT/TauT family transport system ATP-binding protein
MDEPLSALDALTREHLQDLILEIWMKRHKTLVMVTHSIEEAVYLGKRIAVLTQRPANVAALIENPLAGCRGFRERSDFYQQCNRLRTFLTSSCEA